MDAKIQEIEDRFRQFLQRGVVADAVQKDPDGPPYIVAIQDINGYDRPLYILDVLYVPFVSELTFEIPHTHKVEHPVRILDSESGGEEFTHSHSVTHPDGTVQSGSVTQDFAHTHSIIHPERTIESEDVTPNTDENLRDVLWKVQTLDKWTITVKFPRPAVGDHILLWAPNGKPRDGAIIVGMAP